MEMLKNVPRTLIYITQEGFNFGGFLPFKLEKEKEKKAEEAKAKEVAVWVTPLYAIYSLIYAYILY